MVAQLIQTRIAVGKPQIPRIQEMVGNACSQELHRTLDARARGDGRLRGPS